MYSYCLRLGQIIRLCQLSELDVVRPSFLVLRLLEPDIRKILNHSFVIQIFIVGGYVLAAGITMVNKDDMILELMDLLVSWDPDTFKHMFIYIIKIL